MTTQVSGSAPFALKKFSVALTALGIRAPTDLSRLCGEAPSQAQAEATIRQQSSPGLPGIIVLVPGSASLRGMLDLVQQQDMNVGQAATLGVINILLALVAGLLFGNLLLPTRRNL